MKGCKSNCFNEPQGQMNVMEQLTLNLALVCMQHDNLRSMVYISYHCR